MRLPWQHRLFEGRNPGIVFGAFEVLGVLIGKDPDSNKHTGRPEVKGNKHLVFSLT